METEVKMTQGEEILAYIKEHGAITRLDAACELHIFELASRIGELEAKGNIFIRGRAYARNKYGKRTRFTVYRLAEGSN